MLDDRRIPLYLDDLDQRKFSQRAGLQHAIRNTCLIDYQQSVTLFKP